MASRQAPIPASPTDALDFDLAQTRLVAVYGQKNNALKRFSARLEKNPDDPSANYGMGIVYARMGNRAAAQDYLKKTLEKWPFNPYVLSDIGRIYFLNGQFAEALPVLKNATVPTGIILKPYSI